MFQTDQSTAATSLPTPAAAGTQGFFTNGNPAGGTPATILDADFMNMVMMELVNVVEAGGLTPSKTTYNQVLLAIKQMIADLSPAVVGAMRNAQMTVATASASATFTADQIIVGTSLTGLQYVLGSFSKTINLATTGAGGMDTGSAPVSGYVALYAIYNPTTQATALLATNATSTAAPSVYAGANMPSGYTASALVSVWPTNASSQFVVASQRDRKVAIQSATVLTLTSSSASIPVTALSIASAVPPNAYAIDGRLQMYFTTSTISSPTFALYDVSGNGGQWLYATGNSSNAQQWGSSYAELLIPTAQKVYYAINNSVSTSVTYYIYVTAYRF